MSNNISLSIQNEIKNYDNKPCCVKNKIRKEYNNINSPIEYLNNSDFALNSDINDGFKYTTNEGNGEIVKIIKNNVSFMNEILKYKNMNKNLYEEIKNFTKNINLLSRGIIDVYNNKNTQFDFNINKYKYNNIYYFERIAYDLKTPPIRVIFKNFED